MLLPGHYVWYRLKSGIRAPHPEAAVELTHPKGVTEMASAPNPSIFSAMLAESGMQVPEEQVPSLFEGYQHMLRLIDLLGRPATMEAEPAVIFTPEQR